MRTHRSASRRFKRTALSAALGLCLASSVAYGQSNSAGALFGQAGRGDIVVIENSATGFKREIAVSDNGTYRAGQLPVGTYRITVRRADGSTSVRENVGISVGTGTSLNFVEADTTMDVVEVTSSGVINAIDVSSVESSTVLTAERIARIPVPRNITSVALLAPGTVKGDAAFGNLASFGGSSVAENQYYVNGFNITNTFKNLNFAQVPFEAIAEQQIKTGGYGAEFGRSTGGVINLVTKRGSNEFHAGASTYWVPPGTSESPPNQVDNFGNIQTDNSRVNDWEWTSAAWASGALVKDTLFFYVLGQYSKTSNTIYPDFSATTTANRDANAKSPTWLLKMDWNINDSNLLELSAFSDKKEVDTPYYATLNDANGFSSRGGYLGTDYAEQGGKSYSLKYTGYLTDALTLSALAGHGEFERNNYGIAAGGLRQEFFGNVFGDVSGCPVITDLRLSFLNGDSPEIRGCSFVSTIGRPDSGDERDQFRVDLEYSIGDHLIRGGIDVDNFTTIDGSASSGGALWRYGTYNIGGATREDVVRLQTTRTGAEVEVKQDAYYIEDSWNITDDFIGYLGLRWDNFDNRNGNGETYAEIKDQFSPRLGFSWDLNGDSTTKIFGNAGRYALPLTANVAIRGASASLFTRQFFSFTSVDPVTGAPVDPVAVSDIQYINNEFGLSKDPDSISSENLKPMYQDEYILGFQHELSENLSGGLRATYRDLKRAIDDQCDYRPIFEWAEENGYEINPQNTGFAYCHLYNPGEDGIFNVDVDGDGTLEQVTIAADVLGPEAKRTYTALEFFFEGVWEKFFFQGSYTWSKSEGNTEGGVKSDIGQQDTGTTQDFDYPELAIGSDGYLPNDRRHSIKLFGNYEFNEEWSLGANLILQSGRPINCFGLLGGRNTARYQNSYFSCDEGAITSEDGGGFNGTTIVPRGTAGRLPWTEQLDVNLAYRPAYFEGFQVKLDIFNVFNQREVTEVIEFGEDSAGNPQPQFYKMASSWTEGRSARLMFQYDF